LPTNYQNTAAYRVVAAEGSAYFLKLRLDILDNAALTVPRFLSAQSIRQVIVPISNRTGQLWVYWDDYNVILYPFVAGQNAFASPLTGSQWREFGTALKRIHTSVVPPEMAGQLKRETFSPHWRERVARLLDYARQSDFTDPIAAELTKFMRANAAEIEYLVRRCEQLGRALVDRPPEFVLCHSDLHAGNLLVDSGGSIYIVDWDNPILAPKESDLMFIGGGVGGIWNSAAEADLFYQGYGKAEINPAALAYYRMARILEDIAPRAEQLLLTVLGADRGRTMLGIQRWFAPGGVVEMAHQADGMLSLSSEG